MPPTPRRAAVLALGCATVACGGSTPPPAAVAPASLRVEAVMPRSHSDDAGTDTSIAVRFERPLLPASVTRRSFWAFGRWSGPVEGEFRFSGDGRTVELLPRRRLSAGEQVTVVLSNALRDMAGEPLRSAGYSFQFWTRSAPAPMAFETLGVLSTRSAPEAPSRAYGGLASDLNGDGFLDLAVVNEDSADLRVFLNRGDGSGLFRAFLRPTAAVGQRASPSEASDFDRDGRVDVCVANIDANTVSILLGDGSGGFARAQHLPVERAPRGIAVLDVDGDGDIDVVNTNAGSGSLSLLRNDGAGNFGPAISFDVGGEAPWALAAADMDDDGILDLVVGDQIGGRVLVLAGNGDGTFTRKGNVDAGGGVWMLVTADLDGNGTEDVATANGRSNNAAVLLGDGRGGPTRSQTLDVAPFVLATDLGDLDGDGRPDWVLSSYSGVFTVLRNVGGRFVVQQLQAARRAGSCALVFDADNDGDLDLALIDEEADEVRLLRNGR